MISLFSQLFRNKYGFKNQNIIDIIKNEIKNTKADSDTYIRKKKLSLKIEYFIRHCDLFQVQGM